MRRSLPALGVLLLLALLLGALWWWWWNGTSADLGRDDLGGGVTAEAEPGTLPSLPVAAAGDDGHAPIAPGSIALPTMPSGDDAGDDAAARADTPKVEAREENPERYTRKSRRYGSGRKTRKAAPTGTPAPVHQVRLEFEDGSPVKGAEMLHNTRAAGKTDEQGFVRPLPRGPIDWFARSPWFWIGRRLWVKEQRPVNREQGDYVQVMWSAGREVRGVLRDRTGAPISGAVITLIHDAAFAQSKWRATTDESGRFAVSDVTPSGVRIELSGDGLVRYAFPNWIAQGAPATTTEVKLTTARGRAVEIEVKGEDERRVYFAAVEYAYAWPELVAGRRSAWTLQAATDRHGIATIQIGTGIDLKVIASARGHATRTLLAFGDKLPSKVRLTLREQGWYSEPWVPVHCFDATDQRPIKPQVVLARPTAQGWAIGQDIAPTVVWARCHPPNAPDFPVLDLRNLDPGEYDLFIFQPGYLPVTLRAHATPAGIYPPFSVPLHRSGAAPVVKIVFAGSNVTIAHGSLGVQVPAGQGPFIHELVFGGLYTGTNGVITPALPPARYLVQGRASGYFDKTEQVQLRGGDERFIKLRRVPTRR